jgi:hypothetical protein
MIYVTKGIAKVDPLRVLAFADVLAGQSRDERATALYRAICEAALDDRDRKFIQDQLNHARLVRACFLNGAATMLKLLHGEAESRPMADHDVVRLRELLSKYGLLAEEKPPL